MTILAEVSDKIASPTQLCTVMGLIAVVLGVIAFASSSRGVLLLAVPISAFGCSVTLSFLNDPVFGGAVLQEQGWSWFASNLAGSMLPVAAVIIAALWGKRSRRERAGFEVVRSS